MMMTPLPAGLSKLRTMSLHELTVRGQQGLARLADRFAPARTSESVLADHDQALLPDRHRFLAAPLLPVFACRAEVAELLRERFPQHCAALTDRAERALSGRFDLLGFRDQSFGDPPDWQLDPVSGARAPMLHWSRLDQQNPVGQGDPKLIWELNRHAHFVTFGQAWWITRDERFVTAFIRQAEDWISRNPVGAGLNWASSLEIAFRSIAWLWALSLCADSELLTPAVMARLVGSLAAQGRHLETYLSHYFSPNTHLTGEALGLLYLGLALPELKRAGRWRETGLRILLEQLPKQVREDGVYFEQASCYHRYTTDFYLHLLLLAKSHGLALPDAVTARLTGLLDHLMWITRPDSSSPLFGDDDGGRLLPTGPREGNDFRDTLGLGAAVFSRGDWKFVAGAAAAETLWLSGPAGLAQYDQITPAPPAAQSRVFAASGWAVIRDGWERDSAWLLVDCGRHGAEIGCGHAHADALSFEFAAGGMTWLVDPGTFVYAADAVTRDQFRSTAAHNTALVDGEEQSLPGNPFSWRTVTDATATAFNDDGVCALIEGEHDGYQRLPDPVTHRRTIQFCRNQTQLTIRDQFTARTEHRYTLRFHFAPGCAVTTSGHSVRASGPQGRSLSIGLSASTSVSSPLKVRIHSSRVSDCYGRSRPAEVAEFEATGTGPVTLISIIRPEALPGEAV
ncbi:MAG: alginate lyase family protein [Blastocatellia bacterium]